MKITVIIRTIYGQEMIYPACEKSKLFAGLLKQKTFTLHDITFIKKLGYEVEVKPWGPTKL